MTMIENTMLEEMTPDSALPARLPLIKDFVFKAVYGRDTPECKAALIALLNRLLEKTHNPIVDLDYKNPFTIKTFLSEKESILDIKVTLSSGELVDIEMQVGHLEHFRKRAIYYSGKLISESLHAGKEYDKIKTSIMLSIVDGVLFPEYEKAFSTYYYKEDQENTRLDTIAQIKFLELGKIDIKAKPISEMTAEERLGAYFKYAADPEKRQYIDELLAYEAEVINLTEPILEYVSSDEQMREIMEARHKFQLDYNSYMSQARREGLREGREEGLAEGREFGATEKLIEQICKKLRKNKSVEAIADELEEDPAVIERICAAAKQFAPEYDADAIYQSLK